MSVLLSPQEKRRRRFYIIGIQHVSKINMPLLGYKMRNLNINKYQMFIKFIAVETN
jgi:hypothetical protein